MTDKEYEKLKLIEEAIQSFNHKNLFDSSVAFYKSMGYQSTRTSKLEKNNYETFIENFEISKDLIHPERALIKHWQQVEFIFQVTDAEITRVQSLFDTGEVDKNEYQSFLFFTIDLKESNYKRNELVKITREINVPFKMPVIVLFHYGNKLTLSIIDRRLHKKDTNKDVFVKFHNVVEEFEFLNFCKANNF